MRRKEPNKQTNSKMPSIKVWFKELYRTYHNQELSPGSTIPAYLVQLLYEWSHFLASLFENTHIFAQIFSSETKIVKFICKLCLQTAKKVYKNQRTVYEHVNILFNQVYE